MSSIANTLINYLTDTQYVKTIYTLPLTDENNEAALQVADYLETQFYSHNRAMLYQEYKLMCVTAFAARFLSVITNKPRPGLVNLVWAVHVDLIDGLLRPFPESILTALTSSYYSDRPSPAYWLAHKGMPYITNIVYWSMMAIFADRCKELDMGEVKWFQEMKELNPYRCYLPLLPKNHVEILTLHLVWADIEFKYPGVISMEYGKEMMELFGINPNTPIPELSAELRQPLPVLERPQIGGLTYEYTYILKSSDLKK